MTQQIYCAVYDFELFPYALGDVLTWNVQTAMQCEELGRKRTDVYICMDERHPASMYQMELVTADNHALLFNDLHGAFGTHPRLGNIHLYRRREDLLDRLREVSRGDAVNAAVIEEYERAIGSRVREPSMAKLIGDAFAGRGESTSPLAAYFMRHIHSHVQLNTFAACHGRIPLLQPSMGCGPDVAALMDKRFAGKRVVAFHTRLRRLDAGYRGEHTHMRDSDFLEWYAFLRNAQTSHPDVQFVAVGRLQEKPLELLRLPNVLSLRTLGMGLGHELSLMLRSDLFIGTSSGFAAMMNFSRVPYFITRMNRQSCDAYAIEPGSERLPFATERQRLVYEPETRDLLMKLLERGLEGVPPRSGTPPPSGAGVDVRSWEWERDQWLQPGATTSRFFTDDGYCDKETAFLVWPKVVEAAAAWRGGRRDEARAVLQDLESAFPRLCAKFPELLQLRAEFAKERGDAGARKASLADATPGAGGLASRAARRWRWSYPARARLRRWLISVWERKHRIPGKLVKITLGRALGRSGI